MIISDLNYIESIDVQSTEELEGSSGYGYYYYYKKPVEEPVKKEPKYYSFAEAIADAIAVGKNAIALTKTAAIAIPGGASASSYAIAASGGGKYYH